MSILTSRIKKLAYSVIVRHELDTEPFTLSRYWVYSERHEKEALTALSFSVLPEFYISRAG